MPEDDTIRVRPPAAPAGRNVWPLLAAGAALLAAGGLGAWSLTGGRSPEEPAPAPAAREVAALPAVVPTAPPPPPPAAAVIPVQIGDEQSILASRSDRLAIFRMQPAPEILVLVFPTLHAQGLMLNRVGAMMEKAGLQHDRVPTEATMSYVIGQSHVTADTYYSGHDYRASDIRRFFALARAQEIALRPEEEELEAILEREEGGAVLSLTRDLDEDARATILRHELSHGAFFTDPAYAAYSRRFWEHELTEQDRARFRAFLGREDYDTYEEDLMLNETQAYLVHTPDKRFFNAAAVQMSDAHVAKLRAEFVRDMPQGWLRDRTPAAAVTPASAHPTAR